MNRFEQYKAFVTAYDMKSMTWAAKQLNLSTSALSKQIRSLEEHLKCKLFERTNRDIKPTSLAKEFYKKCRGILQAVDEAETSMQAERDNPSGKIRISLSKSLIKSGLFKQIQLFSQIYPDIRFDFRFSERFEDLAQNHIDFAIRIGTLEDHSQLVARRLGQVKPVFCVSPTYLKAHGIPNSYQELSSHRLCLPPLSNLSQAVRLFLKKQKLQLDLNRHDQTNDLEAAYQMAISGTSIALQLDIAIEQELREEKLIRLFPDNPLPKKPIYLIYLKQEIMPEKIRTFRDFIKTKPF